MHDAGFYVDVDDSSHTLNKKIREAQVAQYNFILVVGQQEQDNNTATVRTRDASNEQAQQVTLSLDDLVKMLKDTVAEGK